MIHVDADADADADVVRPRLDHRPVRHAENTATAAHVEIAIGEPQLRWWPGHVQARLPSTLRVCARRRAQLRQVAADATELVEAAETKVAGQ